MASQCRVTQDGQGPDSLDPQLRGLTSVAFIDQQAIGLDFQSKCDGCRFTAIQSRTDRQRILDTQPGWWCREAGEIILEQFPELADETPRAIACDCLLIRICYGQP